MTGPPSDSPRSLIDWVLELAALLMRIPNSEASNWGQQLRPATDAASGFWGLANKIALPGKISNIILANISSRYLQ